MNWMTVVWVLVWVLGYAVVAVAFYQAGRYSKRIDGSQIASLPPGDAGPAGVRIDSLWAFTQCNADDAEEVIAITTNIATSGLRGYVQDFATRSGRPVTLSQFAIRTDQETIAP